MKFYHIFAQNLYSVEFKRKDCNCLQVPHNERIASTHELIRLTKLWTNPQYLHDFYDENKEYFKDSYWAGVTQRDFVLATLNSVPQALALLKSKSQNDKLDELFMALDDRIYQTKDMKLLPSKSKYGSIKGRYAIRLYAIKLESNCYLITGGALKITQHMKDHPHTLLENTKLQYVKTYLQQQDIIDQDSFKELL